MHAGMPRQPHQNSIFTISTDPNKGCPAAVVNLQAPLKQLCLLCSSPAERELYLGGGGEGGGGGDGGG